MEAVGVAERNAVLTPIRVCRLDGPGCNALACLSDSLIATQIEDYKGLRVRHRRSVLTPSREFEMSGRAGHREEDAVVALMVVEASDFLQAESIPIELDDLVESIRMPRDA